MFEKVNMHHPDKIADRIAGALVDYAYTQEENPRVAVEVLIGHGICNIIAESSVFFELSVVKSIVSRIAGDCKINLVQVEQDVELSKNQDKGYRCGDNGIFKGVKTSEEEKTLAKLSKELEDKFKSDGKYIVCEDNYVICQSCAQEDEIREILGDKKATVNPLGYWTGGSNVDSGATNRKLGSDMGRAATGGGLHGKDLSKADVSVNIYCHLLANEWEKYDEVEAFCSIGSLYVCFEGRRGDYKEKSMVSFQSIVEKAKEYIKEIGGFERLAENGLIF